MGHLIIMLNPRLIVTVNVKNDSFPQQEYNAKLKSSIFKLSYIMLVIFSALLLISEAPLFSLQKVSSKLKTSLEMYFS